MVRPSGRDKIFDKANATKWMRRELLDNRDEYEAGGGELNSTKLAENCANAFDVADMLGPLDHEDHWIWDLAVEVTAWAEEAKSPAEFETH